jgi:hypothetical protein
MVWSRPTAWCGCGRLPADLRRFASGEAVDGHLAVDVDHPLRGLRAQAGVLFGYGPADSPPDSSTDSLACVLATVIDGDTARLAPGSVRLTLVRRAGRRCGVGGVPVAVARSDPGRPAARIPH